LQIIRTQLNLFKNSGGRKVIPNDLQRTISALPSPPEIILDGLFGYLHSLEDLWDDEDKQTCVDLIKWANNLRGRRISIDKPSSAKTEAGDLAINAEWVIAVGAVKEDVVVEPGVRVFVVDLGLGKGIWKGVGALGAGRRRRGILGINWDGKWVVELEMIA
jgi:enhancer of mRNA-decapping protein 3